MKVVVIDGVDGAGKTAISDALAHRLGGRCVKAFGGDTGLRIRALNESGAKAEAEALARAAVHRTIAQNKDARLLVFDRHWLSILAYVSADFAPNWRPFPATVLLWATTQVLHARLLARGTPDAELERVAGYARRYDEIAARYEVPRLETTHIGADEAARIIAQNGWVGRPAE